MSDMVARLIQKLVGQVGATAITISHDIGYVEKIADRVVFLHQGQFYLARIR